MGLYININTYVYTFLHTDNFILISNFIILQFYSGILNNTIYLYTN